jgi:hypothetical protein
MNDPRQGVEYQKLLDKSGVDSATMTDWMHRSSRPMLRYMQPAGGARDVTPDFGYARRSVEMGEGNTAASPSNFKLPDIAHVTEGMPKIGKFGESRGMDLEPQTEMPTPSATPPANRPAPQPTSVAAIDKTMPMATMEPNPRRGMELDWSQNADDFEATIDQSKKTKKMISTLGQNRR